MRYVESRRRRAPQRVGRRTTLRVPDHVIQAAEVLAAKLGTTTNDAIIRFAEEGIAAHERRQQIEEIARQRRDAVARSATAGVGGVQLPTPEEIREAMLSGRREP